MAPLRPGVGPEEWMAEQQKQSGTWWGHHVEWLTARSGAMRDAPEQLGAHGFEPMAPAPGTYVHER